MNDEDHVAATLFDGDGEIRALLRQIDWSQTAVGEPSQWPLEIQVMVRQLLNSSFPMWLAWGEDLRVIYNDAYREILQCKHPGALLNPFMQVWAEVGSRVAALLALPLAGQSTPLMVAPFDILRGPQIESVWFNFALSPVLDCRNAAIGVFCLITESTLLVGAPAARGQQRPVGQPEIVDQKYLM